MGLALVLPAVWVQIWGGSSSWWVQGLSLVTGATGVALLWTGMFGARPDWFE
jgi:hypothetical protein